MSAASPENRGVELIRGSPIKPEAVSWLWKGYLVGGCLNILAGAPGTGKTTLALDMAASITSGGYWADGTRAREGDVLIWSGEDDRDNVLLPRLSACGANVNRVAFVGDFLAGQDRYAFDPALDMPELRASMHREKGDWKLIIIDTIASATKGNSNSNAAVRKDLAPLGALAAETGCAVLGIAHFTKGTARRDPLERVTGSLAFGAYARMVLAVARRKDHNGGKRVLTRAKSNLGLDGGGFVYDIEQADTPGRPGDGATHVAWGEAIEGPARKILADAEAEEEQAGAPTLSEVESWLDEMVTAEDGEIEASEARKLGASLGYKERTVYRVREKLGLLVARTGFGVNMRSMWKRGSTPSSASSA